VRRLLLATVAAITLATGAHAAPDTKENEYKRTITTTLNEAQNTCPSAFSPSQCGKTSMMLLVRPHIDLMVQAGVRVCKERIAKGETLPEDIRSCDQFQEWTEDAIAEWLFQP